MAILAGDAMLSRAFEYIARETRGVPADRIVRVIADLGKAVGSEGTSPVISPLAFSLAIFIFVGNFLTKFLTEISDLFIY